MDLLSRTIIHDDSTNYFITLELIFCYSKHLIKLILFLTDHITEYMFLCIFFIYIHAMFFLHKKISKTSKSKDKDKKSNLQKSIWVHDWSPFFANKRTSSYLISVFVFIFFSFRSSNAFKLALFHISINRVGTIFSS